MVKAKYGVGTWMLEASETVHSRATELHNILTALVTDKIDP